MDTTTPTRLALRIADLTRVLAELDGISKSELEDAFAARFVPSLPTSRGIKGAAPLDAQLESTATDAERTARECEEAMGDYDRLVRQATMIVRSPVLKSMADIAKSGKAKAAARRDESEKVAAEARAELAKRQKAREEAMAELEKAQEVAKEVSRIREELASLRATFA